MLKLLMLLVFGSLTALFIVVVASVVLIFSETPSGCTDRVTSPTTTASLALKAEWDKLKRSPTTITLSEDQVTSRGVEFVEAEEVPVDDLQVHFCAGNIAEAQGAISILGAKARIVVQGRLDATPGRQPRIEVDEIKAGSLPGVIAKVVVNFILDRGDVRTLDFKEKLTEIRYNDGSVTITGGP